MLIFFDIDGVLNKKSDWKKLFTLDFNCVTAFSKMVEIIKKKETTKLVSISTWRQGDSFNIAEEAFHSCGLTISGKTPISNRGRQAEIEYYVRRNFDEHCLIIDDDISLYANPERLNIYVTDYKTGFTERDIRKAVKQALRGRICT